jgi:hypothetical protein
MDIHLFVISEGSDSQATVVDAWDGYTIDGNEEGYLKALKLCRKKYGADVEIREAVVSVPDDFLNGLFHTQAIDAFIPRQPEPNQDI